MNKLIKPLAIASTIGILLVVLAGALVTKTGSADGCGANWPLCHDEIIPSQWTLEKMIEYNHRLITGVVGLLILVFSLWMAIKHYKIREIFWVSMSSLFFLFLQSALGALAVIYGQSSAVKALHFGFSLLSFTSVFLLCCYVYQLEKRDTLPAIKAGSKLKLGLILLFIYSYTVVYIGAFVRHTGSSAGCTGWPLCNGEWIPELSGTTGIHYGHRIAALLLFISFIFFFIHVYKHYQGDQILSWSSRIMLLFIILQIISGAVMVLIFSGQIKASALLNTMVSLSHALFICILFGVLCYVLLYSIRKDTGVQVSGSTQDSNKTGIPK